MSINYKEDIEDGAWRDVMSSHLRSIMWLRQKDQTGALQSALGKLYIEFNEVQRRIYMYPNVPYNIYYYLWKGAPSKGRYFHSRIRNTFDYIRNVGHR